MPFSRPIFDPLDGPDEDDPRSAAFGREADAREDDVEDAGEDDRDEDDPDLLDAEFPLGDGVADTAATVWCPYCGEPTEVALDPGGGGAQEYVEDCAVCCRPWRVLVAYGADGSASVSAEAADA